MIHHESISGFIQDLQENEDYIFTTHQILKIRMMMVCFACVAINDTGLAKDINEFMSGMKEMDDEDES